VRSSAGSSPDDFAGRGAPRGREIAHGEFAGEKFLLHLEAQNDVEIVGHLVRIHADQRRLHEVHGEVEFLGVERGGLRRKQRAEARLEVAPETAAARHLVFPQAALRFVHRHAGVDTEGGAQLRRGEPLLVEAVAGLVNRGEEGIERLVGLETRRHAHVAAGAGAKRMQRYVDAAAPVVEADFLRHLAQEGPLALHGEAAEFSGGGFRAGGGG
jgi:hypothetical protein